MPKPFMAVRTIAPRSGSSVDIGSGAISTSITSCLLYTSDAADE